MYKMKPLVRTVNKMCPFTSRWIGFAYFEGPRPMSNYISKIMDKNLIGAEIGVREGDHAKLLLDNLSIEKLYLVDPYLPYDESIKKGVNLTKIKETVHTRLLSPKIIWVEETSTTASKVVPDNLDFVYIDAAHDFENVTVDCHMWYSKVRKGGILGGHDYNGSHKEVKRAVNNFCKENILALKVKNNDWWVIKE